MATYAAKLKDLEKRIARCDRKLETAEREEAKARGIWNKKFRLYTKRGKIYRGLKDITTQKAQKLRELLDWWDDHGWKSTKKRDEARAIIVKISEERAELNVQKHELIVRVQAESKATDDIIEQILILFGKARLSHRELEQYLLYHLKRRLIGIDGKLHSQISLTHSNGRDRVVASVRSINKIIPDKAEEALGLIEAYNSRTSPSIIEDETTKEWRDLIKGLLNQKIKFTMGDGLGRFLGAEIDEGEAPELTTAQHLLATSLTSEKSEPCVRVLKREDRASPFIPVPFK